MFQFRDQIPKTLMDLIISLKISDLQNKYSQSPSLQKQQQIQVQKYLEIFHNIFSKSLEKSKEGLKSFQSFHQIYFKMISNHNQAIIAEEIWQIQYLSNIDYNSKRVGKNQFDNIPNISKIEDLLKDTICLSKSVPKWGHYLNALKSQQKYNKLSITYQILQVPTRAFQTHQNNKLGLSFVDKSNQLKCKVSSFCSIDLYRLQDYSELDSQVKHLRKESTSTISSLTTSPLSNTHQRKISICSFYDQENDITILSSDSFSIQSCSNQQVSNIEIALNTNLDVESDDDFQQISEQMNPKLSCWRQKIKQFQLTFLTSSMEFEM